MVFIVVFAKSWPFLTFFSLLFPFSVCTLALSYDNRQVQTKTRQNDQRSRCRRVRVLCVPRPPRSVPAVPTPYLRAYGMAFPVLLLYSADYRGWNDCALVLGSRKYYLQRGFVADFAGRGGYSARSVSSFPLDIMSIRCHTVILTASDDSSVSIISTLKLKLLLLSFSTSLSSWESPLQQPGRPSCRSQTRRWSRSQRPTSWPRLELLS